MAVTESPPAKTTTAIRNHYPITLFEEAVMYEVYAKIGPAGAVLVLLSVASLYLALKNLTLLALISRAFRKRFALI